MTTNNSRWLLAVLVVTVAFCAMSVQAFAAATINLVRAPAPPQAVVSNGSSQVSYNYSITFDSTPDEYTVEILNPSSVPVSAQTFNITGLSSPISNNGAFTVPNGAVAGAWSVRVRYYSTVQLEQTARVIFYVAPSTGTLVAEKYEDLNGNGVLDPGEPGLPDWPITVIGPDPGGVNAVTTQLFTGADGSVHLPNLLIGTYHVQEGNRTGWRATVPTTQTVTVSDGPIVKPPTPGGVTANTARFLNMRVGAICGMAYRDENGNGVRDADETAAVTGVGLTLSGEANATATVGADGRYCFENLTPGDYQVAATGADGLVHSGDADGPGNGINTIGIISVSSGQRVLDRDFGYRAPAAICGVAYRDDNGNGVRDPQEARRISQVSITLGGTATATTTTGANGEYCFENLVPGVYHVNAGTSPGLSSTGDADGPDNGRATIGPIPVRSGARVTDRDFGYGGPAAKLRLVKTADKRVVRSGGLVKFRMKVTNVSSSVARDVVITDPIPAGVSLANLGKGRLIRGQLTWRVGNLAPGKSRTVTFTVRTDRTDRARVVRNVARAEAANARMVSSSATVRATPAPRAPRQIPVTG